MKHLVLFTNTADLFLSHRQHLARGAQSAGYRVTVLCPPGDAVQDIRKAGLHCETVSLGRKSINPFIELLSVFSIYRTLRRLNPDAVHSFTIKPVLYTSLIGRWLKIPNMINTVTGLGYAFI